MIQYDDVRITFVGDIMLGGEYITFANKNKIELLQPFKKIDPYFKNTDIFVFNLEGPLCTGGDPRGDVSAILSNHPKLVEFLNNRNICIAIMANNHMMDYGKNGLKNSLELLRQNGIFTVGAGLDEDEANRPLIFTCKGKNIAILGLTSDEPHIGSVIAVGNKAGTGSYKNMEKSKATIRELRCMVDIIIVSMHWGYEYYLYPSLKQVNIAREIADAGANFIIGHHPHVIQGIEKHNDSLIMYSLGNFFFPTFQTTGGRIDNVKKIAKEFVVIHVDVNNYNKYKLKYIGGNIDKLYNLVVYNNTAEEKFLKYMDYLSSPILQNNYDVFWGKYKEKRYKELVLESLFDAFKKIYMMKFNQVIKTITIKDIQRNIERLKMVTLFRKKSID